MIQVPTYYIIGNSKVYSRIPEYIFAQAEVAFLNGISHIELTPREYAQVFGIL